MKIPGLEGDYCPPCATVIAGHIQNPKMLIVLCGSVCHSTLQQNGDYQRLMDLDFQHEIKKPAEETVAKENEDQMELPDELKPKLKPSQHDVPYESPKKRKPSKSKHKAGK